MFTIKFGDYEFPNQTFEVQGLPVENDIREDAIPRRDGSIIATPYMKSRKITIKGTIHNSTAAASILELVTMQAALLAGERDLQFMEDIVLKCRGRSIKPDFASGTDKAVIDIDIGMIAANPFYYYAGASIVDAQTPVKGTTLTFDVYNAGTAYSEPKFSFCAAGGTVNDDIALTNVTTGKSLRFRGLIANGQTMTVDTESYEVLNNGTDGLSYFEGDFPTVAAGTNSFQFVGATLNLTTEFKYRWY